MDTDYLSKEAYKAVIIEAEKFCHDLTTHFGVLASSCKNEEEYLKKAKELVNEIKKLKGYQLLDAFFGNILNEKELQKILEKVLSNISEVEKIPMTKRCFDF